MTPKYTSIIAFAVNQPNMAINPSFYVLLVLLFSLGNSADATVFTIVNKCTNTVWPGTLAAIGDATLGEGGFSLATGASVKLTAPAGWSGRFWARTGCTFDAAGNGKCLTGDCGKLKCTGSGASPATLAEFTIADAGNGGCLTGYCGKLKCTSTGATPATQVEFIRQSTGNDYYDVSLVDGYNVGIWVNPTDGNGSDCKYAGCAQDLNPICPSELRVKDPDSNSVVGCKSACAAFNEPQYCCTGAYSTPETCKPTKYYEVFKEACPKAYNYAYDASGTHTCGGANYEIIFCAS